jgi:hypothetical protein
MLLFLLMVFVVPPPSPGRLAKAFTAGYYCADEEELLRTCGVQLGR